MQNSRHDSPGKPWGIVATLLLLALALAGCTTAMGANKTQLTLAAEPAELASGPTPNPKIVSTPPDSTEDALLGSFSLIYNGEIMPEKIVPVVAEVAGQVLELDVEVGASVKAGDRLLRIDSTVAEAQHAQALAGLELAQSQLELATQEPEATDLEAARAGVDAAQAAYQRALAGATEEDKRMVLAQLRQAEAAVSIYQAQYDRIAGSPFAAMMPESLQLQQATLALEAAQAQYDKVLKGATADQIAGAYAQLTGAKAQLARLEEGAKPAQIKAAEAGVKQAELGVYLAQLQVDKTTIEAPIDGFVYKLDAVEGAMTGPGNPVMILFSHQMKIVISVEESRSQEVHVGQPATISVDAYPERTFTGEVAAIAPTFDAATRTVQVTVRPTGADATDLASGMFATVTLMER